MSSNSQSAKIATTPPPSNFTEMFASVNFGKVTKESGDVAPPPPSPPKKKRSSAKGGDFNEIMSKDQTFAEAMDNIRASLKPKDAVPVPDSDTPSRVPFTASSTVPPSVASRVPSGDDAVNDAVDDILNGTLDGVLDGVLNDTVSSVVNGTDDDTPKGTLKGTLNGRSIKTPGTAGGIDDRSLEDKKLCVSCMSEAYAKVLIMLMLNDKNICTKPILSKRTGIPKNSIANALKYLRTHGIITTEHIILHAFRGFTYTCSAEMVQLFCRYNATASNYFSVSQDGQIVAVNARPKQMLLSTETTGFGILDGVLNGALNTPVNASLNGVLNAHLNGVLNGTFPDAPLVVVEELKTTTTTIPTVSTISTILEGPEACYWIDLGMKEPQPAKWCQEFGIQPLDMRQQLAWARWDLLNNGKEADVTKDVISWFYGILRRTGGCYNPAKGYKTPEELRAERMREVLSKTAAARDELAKLDIEARFQEILNDPSGDEYQALHNALPDVMRDRKGKMLESAMREIHANRLVEQEANSAG
ncbi:MAG: hypothetical protein WCP20_23630 [Desulfuromonadales bacterium]